VASEHQQVEIKRERKKRKEVPNFVVYVVVPLICASIGAIGIVIGARIGKASPSPAATSAPATPAPLGTGQYTVSSSALGYLDVPNPNGSGLTEYGCQTLPTRTGNSNPELCIDELDVVDSDMGVGTQQSFNKVWNIEVADGSTDYAIQSAYRGRIIAGLSLNPPSCNHFTSRIDSNGISYGYLVVTSSCSAALPSSITDTFDIVPVAGGYEVRNNGGLCLTAINNAGGNGTSTHTRFDECAVSESGYQVWAINPVP
jgi:hypothetical protein